MIIAIAGRGCSQVFDHAYLEIELYETQEEFDNQASCRNFQHKTKSETPWSFCVRLDNEYVKGGNPFVHRTIPVVVGKSTFIVSINKELVDRLQNRERQRIRNLIKELSKFADSFV